MRPRSGSRLRPRTRLGLRSRWLIVALFALVGTAAALAVDDGVAESATYVYDAVASSTTSPANTGVGRHYVYDGARRSDGRALAAGFVLAAKGGTRPVDPVLDATGKVHGVLPKPADLGRYDPEDLARLGDDYDRAFRGALGRPSSSDLTTDTVPDSPKNRL